MTDLKPPRQLDHVFTASKWYHMLKGKGQEEEGGGSSPCWVGSADRSRMGAEEGFAGAFRRLLSEP
jgi:hypothetical protein